MRVDANYRFIAAYQEVNARVAQRQQALGLYVSLVVSLLAALVALRTGAGADRLPAEWLLPGFPVAALTLALLNYKAERAITNLRRFLAELERLDGADADLPSYNTDPRWSTGANAARRFHDHAATLLAAGGLAVGWGAGISIYPERVLGSPWLLGVGGVLGALALVLLAWTPRFHYRPGA